jgi:ribosomal protein S18 acetylase RimI-like enzyme
MGSLGRLRYLRACTPADDAFLYDVFCTTWMSEIAGLPNPDLAPHVLRIQHTAQERRFDNRYPGRQRFVILDGGEPAGRLYVHEGASTMHLIDLTLLDPFRRRGIGGRLARDLFAHATEHRMSINLRVARRNLRAYDVYSSLGFRPVRIDDVDSHLEWTPGSSDDRALVLAEAGCS